MLMGIFLCVPSVCLSSVVGVFCGRIYIIVPFPEKQTNQPKNHYKSYHTSMTRDFQIDIDDVPR